MTRSVEVPSAVRHHRSFDAFAGAHRVVFEQVRVFPVDPDFAMPSLAGVSREVRAGASVPSHGEADYYDTDELALAADGLAVRWDLQKQEWTAVLPAVSVTGAPIRCEAGFPGSPDVVPDAVKRLLQLRLHQRPIEKVAQLDSRRVTTPLISRRTDIRLADVIDDNVVATRVDGDRTAYRCIRVEVLDLDGLGCALLEDVCETLTRAGCRTEAPVAELARAFGPPTWSR